MICMRSAGIKPLMYVVIVCVIVSVFFFFIFKACSDSKSRPGFLTDKALDPAIKAIVKKFPVTDTKVHFSIFTN